MPPRRSRLRPLSAPTFGLLLLIPVSLFMAASLLKHVLGLSSLYDGLGFLADPMQVPWYNRISPVLFLGGPLAAAALSLWTIVRFEVRWDAGQLITTVIVTPRRWNLAVASASVLVLAVLAAYLIGENLGHA